MNCDVCDEDAIIDNTTTVQNDTHISSYIEIPAYRPIFCQLSLFRTTAFSHNIPDYVGLCNSQVAHVLSAYDSLIFVFDDVEM